MKKTATINKFKTSESNKKYIQSLKDSNEFDIPESTIVEYLLNLGIKEHKNRRK